jgi:nucleoside-diphosphate-sugar epimerase
MASASWFGLSPADVESATEGATHYFNFAVLYDRANVSDDALHQVNVVLPERVMSAIKVRGNEPICVLGDSFFTKFSPNATAQGRYTRTKVLQRKMAEAMTADGRLSAAMLRIEQAYGPGEAQAKIFPSVVGRMLRHEPRIALTEGLQQRDFVFVDDVVEAAIMLAERRCPGTSVIDCGTGISTAVREVFERLHLLTGSRSVLAFGDYPADQTIECSKADTRCLEAAGWSPKVSLDEGLHRLVNSMRQPNSAAFSRETIQ